MKKVCLFLTVAAMLLVMSTMVLAEENTQQSIGVSVSVDSSGVSLPIPKTIRKCPGTLDPKTGDPWSSECSAASDISFGDLTTTLSDGSDAGCFYAPDFFIVYLYPDAWGGVGYQIDQNFVWTTAGIPDESLVFTAVYSDQDRYAGLPAQGDMPSGALLGTSGDGAPEQAVGTHRVYKSDPTNKLVIVRAQYGLPPVPASGNKDDIYSGWKPVPKSTPATTYSGQLTITISPT